MLLIFSFHASLGLFSQVKQPEQQKNTGLFTQENLFGQNSQQQSNLFGQTALQTAFAQVSLHRQVFYCSTAFSKTGSREVYFAQ